MESNSPCMSPVVLVRKKNGNVKFCVDYCRLNTVTRKDVFPLLRIDDLLDELAGRKVFSTIDAKSSYWQIRVAEKAQLKTSFVTMSGLYEFKVMPFGLCNAPTTFERWMQKMLADLDREGKFCSVYLDDIIVYSCKLSGRAFGSSQESV